MVSDTHTIYYISGGLSYESAIIQSGNRTRAQRLKRGARKKRLQRFLAQLNDPLIFILFIAASISMLLGEYSDTLIILSVILVNALVGIIQEGKAQRALHALKEMSSPKALLIKDGNSMEIPAADLIPGDEVLLDAGRQVPADLLITESNCLKIEESALTGESLPVEKDTGTHNRAYLSTNVTYSRGKGTVTACYTDGGLQRYLPLYETPAPSQGRKSLRGRRTFLHGLLRSADWFYQHQRFPLSAYPDP